MRNLPNKKNMDHSSRDHRALRSARRRFYQLLTEERDARRAFADRLNNLTPEQVAKSMEQLPRDVLEFAVRFEALSHCGRNM